MADAYADRLRATEPEQPAELSMLETFASMLTGERRVLDAGCGTGRLLPVLAALDCAVEGVDLSPGMVRRAQADHPTFVTKVASMTDLPHADGSFDGYVAWYSLIHSADDELPRVFREACRVLQPGGVLLTAFQSGHGTRDVSGAYGRPERGHTLLRYRRTPDRVVRMMAETGLREVARLERGPAGPHERDSQAVLIARR